MFGFEVMQKKDATSVPVCVESDDTIFGMAILHRTKAGAEKVLDSKIPEGEDPKVYGGFYIRSVNTDMTPNHRFVD